MGRRFVWFASVALIGASSGAIPLRAQPPVIVGQDRRSEDDRYCDDERRRDDRYCEDRRRDDPVYRDRDWSRDGELRQPGRNGRGAENGRGKKNGLRKRNPGNSERNSARYPDSRYPDSRYPDSRYPDSRYPDGNSDVYGGYRTLNVDRQYYPTNGQCRVWFADRPERYQLPAMNCDRLYGRVPARSFILYNYRAWDGDFDWYRYDQQNPGRVPRVIVEISRSMRGSNY